MVTRTELKAVQLTAQGYSNYGIAMRMGTTTGVVKLVLRRAALRLGLQTGHRGSTRAQLSYWLGKNERGDNAHLIRPECNGRAKLTIEQIRLIRRSKTNHAALAAQFGVQPRQILRIRARQSWGKVA